MASNTPRGLSDIVSYKLLRATAFEHSQDGFSFEDFSLRKIKTIQGINLAETSVIVIVILSLFAGIYIILT